MATGGEGSCILTSLLHHNGKPFNVFLTPKTLCWCPEGSDEHPFRNISPRFSIPLKEIITVVPHEDETFQDDRGEIEMSQIASSSFVVHAVKRIKLHKWRTKKLVFDCRTSGACREWMEKIQQLLDRLYRPKRLLVFVNPVGGRKLAEKVYKEKVEPLFDLADINAEVIVTERANHAKDYIELETLEKLDGIITVGGDGMFHEVLNGLIKRIQMDHNIDTSNVEFEPIQPGLTIGVIPAGSTDAVAYCTTGNNDPITSALHVIIGDTHPLDVCSVKHGTEVQRYSVSMAAYGFFGDVLKDSEKLRWMGPKRYDYSGFKKFLSYRSYEGSVTFLQDESLETHPNDNSRCRTGCLVCNQATRVSRGSNDGESGAQTEKKPPSGSKWTTIDGRFISVIGANMSCVCAKSPEGISPSAHLADGCLDLILVKHTSRLQYLRHMLRLAGKSDHFNFPFVDVFRVKEFHFKPCSDPADDEPDEGAAISAAKDSDEQVLAGATQTKLPRQGVARSMWNVDGELVEQAGVHVRVHCQLVKIFARGIEECNDTPSCALCTRRI